MIQIAITPTAFEAIERTLALGIMAAEPQVNEEGERLIWLEPRFVDKLNSIRRPGWPRCGKDIGHTSDVE
jgi:hypothetical protein